MKLEIPKIPKKDMVKFLPICNGRSPLPILANILLEASDNKVTMTASNLEVTVKQSYDATVVEPGNTTIQGKRLVDIIDRMGDEPILVDGTDRDISFVQGNSKFKLPTLSAEDFPRFEQADATNMSIDISHLIHGLKRVAYAASSDNSRFNLDTILFENNILVATDGHRLSKVTMDININKRIMLPLSAANAIMRSFPSSQTGMLSVSEKQLTISEGDVTLSCRLTDGDYPDYNKVIPTEHSVTVEASRTELLASIKRIEPVITPQSSGIDVAVTNNEIKLHKQSEIGFAEDSMLCLSNGSFEFIANSKYLIEGVTTLETDNIKMVFIKEGAPVMLNPVNDPTHISLVMPMRK